MITTLTDLLFTTSAIGLVTIVAGVGVAALPWRSAEVEKTADAMDAAARLPLDLVRLVLAPKGTPAPAISR